MSREPTEKQMRLAEAISAVLGLKMPKEMTRQSLFLFIRDNKAEYDVMRTESLDRDDDCYMAEAIGIDIMTGCLGD